MTDPSSGKMNFRQPEVQDIYLRIAFHYIQNCRTFTYPSEASEEGWTPVVSQLIVMAIKGVGGSS